jgi:hypothetical protein
MRPPSDPVIEVVADLFDKIAYELEELAVTTRRGAEELRAQGIRESAQWPDNRRQSLRVVDRPE